MRIVQEFDRAQRGGVEGAVRDTSFMFDVRNVIR
jgi:hypothetical protein